ncbi:MAG: hypothetical protein HYT97_05240 [Elusimicrobia bacterium]|nr:hypothetical protein [Elusimicrobiota bacterium]
MAKLILHRKRIHQNGAIEERVIWLVQRTFKHPQGIRYRLAYISKPRKKPLVLYDNHHPKGHHKHIKQEELTYQFSTVERLLSDFKKDVQEAIKNENF